jgi:hypothetical protein
MADDEKETSEDENPVHDEIEFDEEVESLPPVVIVEDNSEKGNKLLNEDDWGDSTQELHLENIGSSLNQINLNLDKIKYVNKNLMEISLNFDEANEHLWWVALGVKLGLIMMSISIFIMLVSLG